MNIDLKKIYLEVLNEYNKTPHATKDGWRRDYSDYTFKQIEMINNIIKSGDKILDIGTGSGIVPICFNKIGYDVTTIDYDESGGNSLKNIDIFKIKNQNVNLNHGRLPFENETFNIINLGDVIEHLPNSPKKILKECNRVLKKNGYFLVSTPNSTRLINRLKLLIGHSVWPDIKSFYDDEYNGTHHHEYTYDELIFVLNDNGFKKDNIHFFEENLNIDNRLNSFTGKIIKKFLKVILFIVPRLKSNMILRVKKN
jgi:2-polyprenyl-3-methyl-5-hydroxy-6-metoxy-1,4-benzoquinol methylase|tara:strand:- start:79 stop:840 length:762 start_codon:yes stop_codon:yes gene_type:complete